MSAILLIGWDGFNRCVRCMTRLIEQRSAEGARWKGEENGRGDWIRTSDIPLPKRTLYQAEPRPDPGYCIPARTIMGRRQYLGKL